MTTATYSVREAKARLSEILRGLEAGDEAIITRRGKPCGRIVPIDDGDPAPKPSLETLRGALAGVLPDAEWEDFMDAKKIWEPRMSYFVDATDGVAE